jgi:hypothetical protein
MNEGWDNNEEYLVIFSKKESNDKTQQYKLALYLPGYSIVGLKGWDDFIVVNQAGNLFTVPTVPLTSEYLEEFSLPSQYSLAADERFQGKIKWYIKPIVFGGDPEDEENLTWVNHKQHIELVNWWNERFHAMSSEDESA